MTEFLLISESAIDRALTSAGFVGDSFLPDVEREIYSVELTNDITGYRVEREPIQPYCAVIKLSSLMVLRDEGARPSDIYRRIVRVLKGLKSPPVHLPRLWSEYHYKNLIAFFASPREVSSMRWVAELNGDSRCVKFDFLSSSSTEVDLHNFSPVAWPQDFGGCVDKLIAAEIAPSSDVEGGPLANEVDLKAIGSSSVVAGRSYAEWERLLTESQTSVLQNNLNVNIGISGPAGSGKTLALCMRALQIAMDEGVVSQGKKVLICTHSWAMAERVDDILTTLNGGIFPEGVTVFPLLSLLEFHAGNIGRLRVEVLGNDSTDGHNRSIKLIGEILNSVRLEDHKSASQWIREGLGAKNESRARLDLALNLHEEISGVISASGVATDDPDSIRRYLSEQRQEWMPPFTSIEDRSFVIAVYTSFVRELIDRSAITTDQFVLDSLRILETFAWRMRKETDGYDYVLVDELQYFDPQERSALELLGRSRIGIPFITAEDPSQGVFAALHSKSRAFHNAPVYLETMHRFDRGIFDLIRFLYQRFPLNAVPLRISHNKDLGPQKPRIFYCNSDEEAIHKAASVALEIFNSSDQNDRICLATLGDVDTQLVKCLEEHRLQVTQLKGVDDVEQLAYSKRSVIVSPWQFVGGTQFASVIVVAAAIGTPSTQFARLREQISVYLACSRAAKSLNIVCGDYLPVALAEAEQHNLLIRK